MEMGAWMGYCDLWKTSAWESVESSLVLVCSPICFPLVLSENSCHSRNPVQHSFLSGWIKVENMTSSGLFWGLCLWSNTTHGIDTVKTLLGIWLLTRKSATGEKWLWQTASVNDGPHVQSQALKAVKSSLQRMQSMESWLEKKMCECSVLDMFFWMCWV